MWALYAGGIFGDYFAALRVRLEYARRQLNLWQNRYNAHPYG
jgi:hypothetical protein